APVTLAEPSMRPRPLAAGFRFCRHGSVARAGNSAACASSRRDRLSAMPLAVTHLTNSRREGRMDTSWLALSSERRKENCFLRTQRPLMWRNDAIDWSRINRQKTELL